MVVLSNKLTSGQIAFVLRTTIQILSYGCFYLLGLIVLNSAPRVASVDTHGMLNRIVGSSTATSTSVKWMYKSLRGRNGDPIFPTRLLIALVLSALYGMFISLTDIGLLGLYSCSPEQSSSIHPASIQTHDDAAKFVAYNLVNGSDPHTIRAYLCDAVQVVSIGEGDSVQNCTAWRSSTYDDPGIFHGLNTTDTGVLMPSQLRHTTNPLAEKDVMDLNSWYSGVGSTRVVDPVVSNGLVVDPHATGVRVAIGVPSLRYQQRATLDKTMALEVDVGCMALGIYTRHNLDSDDPGQDLLDTKNSWNEYTGPDNLRDVLQTTAQAIRQYYTPLFNNSTLDQDGLLVAYKPPDAKYSRAAMITPFDLPDTNSTRGDDAQSSILGNCTQILRGQLNLPALDHSDNSTAMGMCSLLAISGSQAMDGIPWQRLSRMVCASTTQINMVSATVKVDLEDNVTLDIQRLPSTLNYLQADYWTLKNDTTYIFSPFKRYTLSDSPNSSSTHFISVNDDEPSDSTARYIGPGSGGSAFSTVAAAMLNPVTDDEASIGISLLDGGFNNITLAPSTVTRWAGQVGASFILASTAYNGWAALSSEPITVYDDGGKEVACYDLPYATAFLPIVLASSLVACWALVMFINSALADSNRLQELYGGLNAYGNALYGTQPREKALLVWKDDPKPHLEVLAEDELEVKDVSETATKFLKLGVHKRTTRGVRNAKKRASQAETMYDGVDTFLSLGA